MNLRPAVCTTEAHTMQLYNACDLHNSNMWNWLKEHAMDLSIFIFTLHLEPLMLFWFHSYLNLKIVQSK